MSQSQGRRSPRLFGIHARPGQGWRWVLAALPFVLVIGVYLVASDLRHRDNPSDKLLPRVSEMADAVERVAFTEDRRSGEYILWQDTLASLKRLLLGIGMAATVGLLLGLNMGLFPGLRSALLAFVTFLSMVPPLAILPILFISLGVDELAKVMLIFLGTFPIITRDIYLAVNRIPREQITKALTLGASQLALVYRIVLPQVLPRLIDAVRLTLGAAWLFLIAAEAIASTDGLGYRIFLVRRYLAMDVILPYVLWITFLGFTMDWALRRLLSWRFGWYLAAKS
jgi:NitT/TauT family transport system permease protein